VLEALRLLERLSECLDPLRCTVNLAKSAAEDEARRRRVLRPVVALGDGDRVDRQLERLLVPARGESDLCLGPRNPGDPEPLVPSLRRLGGRLERRQSRYRAPDLPEGDVRIEEVELAADLRARESGSLAERDRFLVLRSGFLDLEELVQNTRPHVDCP
jgi:hypothetical protein